MKRGVFVGVSNNVKLVLKISAIAVTLAYFLFHTVSGENGLISYIKAKRDVKIQDEKLQKLSRQLDFLKLNVELLSDRSLDLDLLEERCRTILNYSAPDDKIVKIKTITDN